MTKKILEALQTKFNGVEEKTLNRIAEKVGKTITNEEDIATAVEGVSFQQVLESYGDERATAASQSAVKNYEKKYGIKDGKVIETPQPEPEPKEKPESQVPDYMKQMQAQMEAMQKQMAAMTAERVSNTRKAQIDALLADVPEALKSLYESNYNQMAFADDDAFNAYLETSKANIETLKNDYAQRGAVAKPIKGGRTEKKEGEASADILAYMERATKEADAQPSVIRGL